MRSKQFVAILRDWLWCQENSNFSPVPRSTHFGGHRGLVNLYCICVFRFVSQASSCVSRLWCVSFPGPLSFSPCHALCCELNCSMATARNALRPVWHRLRVPSTVPCLWHHNRSAIGIQKAPWRTPLPRSVTRGFARHYSTQQTPEPEEEPSIFNSWAFSAFLAGAGLLGFVLFSAYTRNPDTVEVLMEPGEQRVVLLTGPFKTITLGTKWGGMLRACVCVLLHGPPAFLHCFCTHPHHIPTKTGILGGESSTLVHSTSLLSCHSLFGTAPSIATEAHNRSRGHAIGDGTAHTSPAVCADASIEVG